MEENKENIILERIKEGNLYLSLLSLISCILLFLIIFYNKKLSPLTYTFLMYILLSELLNSIGNIIQSTDIIYKEGKKNIKKRIIISFISFSDIFTYLLFLFFSYSSLKLIKETNKLIKEKTKTYIIISFVISVLYCLIFTIIGIVCDDIIDIRFKDYYSEKDKNKDAHFKKSFYFLSFIHILTIIFFTYFISSNTLEVIDFLKEKLKRDKVKSSMILRLIKVLFRYSIICLLYWIFLIPRILFVSQSGENNNIFRDIIYLLSESFFCLRGFLIVLNTIRSTKMQTLINRFLEVNIKHFILLHFGVLSSKNVNLSKNNESVPLVLD